MMFKALALALSAIWSVRAAPECAAVVGLGARWVNVSSSTAETVLDLTFTNPGTDALPVPWTLPVANPLYVGAPQSWNVESAAVAGGTFTAQATQPWEALLPSSVNAANMGLVVSYSGAIGEDVFPASITIGGANCTLTAGPPSQGPPASTAVSTAPSATPAPALPTTSSVAATRQPTTLPGAIAAAPSTPFTAPLAGASPAPAGRKLLR